MSRRDTILIAVLINMGLLVILFVGALQPKSVITTLPQGTGLAKKEEAVRQKIETSPAPSVSAIDQVDHILSQYVEKEAKRALLPSPQPAPPPPTPAVIETQKLKEIIVKQGDVLEKIAKAHHTSVEEILRVNKLNDTSLQIGQILYLPDSNESPVKLIPTKEAKYYTVKNGDNPWTIAIKNKIKVEDLLHLNGLDEAKAKKLKPGDQLRIQ